MVKKRFSIIIVFILCLVIFAGSFYCYFCVIPRQNNVEIKRIAEKYNCEFIDLFTPLLDPITNEVYAGYTFDGAHFTALGYEVVTSLIEPKLKELLGK